MLFFPSSSSFNLPPAPIFSDEQSESCPPKSPLRSPPHTSPTVAPPSPGGSVETKHNVPYFRYFSYCLGVLFLKDFFFLTFSFKFFRSEMANETERLTSLSLHWESKVEDESIPEESEFIFYTNWLLKPWIFNFGSVDSGCFSYEENGGFLWLIVILLSSFSSCSVRDRMRTAVGQARLLMKERFNQFSGLVDDCELGRGEKITTCTDLQGFWDMVYYQVMPQERCNTHINTQTRRSDLTSVLHSFRIPGRGCQQEVWCSERSGGARLGGGAQASTTTEESSEGKDS